MSTVIELATELLQLHWSHPFLRPAQAESIQYTADGHDVLAVLPTGMGKSICFQIPAMLFDGCVLVVSPLISLMKDQVDDAVKRGVLASYVNSHVSEKEATRRLTAWAKGEFKLFYIAPERFLNAEFREAMKKVEISLLALDEAHVFSLWGTSFRPAYLRVREFMLKVNPRPPILAVTATATVEVAKDVAKAVGLADDYKLIVADPIRPNFTYVVASAKNELGTLHELVRGWDVATGRYLIYTGTRDNAEQTAKRVQEWIDADQCVGFYHAGMQQRDRTDMQDRFKTGRLRIMAATNAFGMGIDVPDVRGVVHLGTPGSIEAYAQEIGRAGRDGKPSTVTLIPTTDSLRLQHTFIRWENPPYPSYALVWRWLHRNLQPDQTLLVSDSRIADEVGERISARDVGTILQVMHGQSMVERTPIPFGSSAVAHVPTLRKIVVGALVVPPTARKVAKAAWELFVEKEVKLQPGLEAFDFGLDKEALSEAAGIPVAGLALAIRAVTHAGGWETMPRDYSKTTRIIAYNGRLADLLPASVVEAKLVRDNARLAKMVAYSQTTTQAERIDMIRAYFLAEKK